MTATEPLGPHTTVRIGTSLRVATAGNPIVYGLGDTVGIIFDSIEGGYPGFLERVLDGDGQVRRFLNVMVGDEEIKALQGLATPVPEGVEVAIISAAAGG